MKNRQKQGCSRTVASAFSLFIRPSFRRSYILSRPTGPGEADSLCTQCPQGTVLLGIYETSNALKNAGAVSGKDMTTEAAIAKMYYLFSKGYDVETICRMMETDIRGEMKS